MIIYDRGGLRFFLNVFQRHGSVFPFSLAVALPCATISVVLKYTVEKEIFDFLMFLKEEDSLLKNNAIWSGFMFLVGFLIVFRTSQAYHRFWDGCTSLHFMRAEWFDACSSLTAFCIASKASEDTILKFQHTLVRLFSMLHAVALAEIEDTTSSPSKEIAAFNYRLVDIAGIDAESLQALKLSDAKVELVFQWIQQLIVQNIDSGVLSIAPPIVSRSFQELANGMVKFHDAIKISTTPFPFPYAQTCDCMLMLHWLIVPFVTIQYTSSLWSAGLFTCLLVFILWSLNTIALELENPFGADANDIDTEHMQTEMNRHLCLLLEPSTKRTPTLSPLACLNPTFESSRLGASSFSQVWNALPNFESEGSTQPVRSMRGERIHQLKALASTFHSTSSSQSDRESCVNTAATRPGENCSCDLLKTVAETDSVVQQHSAEQIMQSRLDTCSPLVHVFSPRGLPAPDNSKDLRPGLSIEAPVLGVAEKTTGGSLLSAESRSRSPETLPIGRSQPDGHLTSVFCCASSKKHPATPKSREQLPHASENLREATITYFNQQQKQKRHATR